MTTRITANNIVAGAITSDLIAANAVTLDKIAVGTFGPRITGIVLPGSAVAVLPNGSETFTINGSNFQAGVQVYIGTTPAASVVYISSTQLVVTVPVMSPGTYPLYVTNTDGGTAIRLLAITVSTAPVWATDSVLPAQIQNISLQLSAVSDSSVVYSLASGSSLPPGLSLSSAGLLFGTFTGTGTGLLLTYNFTVIATDLESQTNSRSFSVSIILGDSNFSYVPLLLQTGSTNSRSTTATDLSASPITLTRNGSVSTGWTSPYQTDGYWSNYFNGTAGTRISTPANTAFSFGTGDFTVEAWIYPTASPSGIGQIIGGHNSGSNADWVLFISATNYIGFYGTNGGTQFSAGAAVPLNQWTHIAMVIASTVPRIYYNGVLSNTGTASQIGGLGNATTITIGDDNTGNANSAFTGYISNLRVVKGTAVYTSNFALSTVPLTTISGTSLLTCQSNRFKDNSTNNFAIASTGTPRATFDYYPSTFAAPAASVGAGYFPLTSADYLQAPASAAFAPGTGDFTLECWVYWVSGTDGYIWTQTVSGTNYFMFTFASSTANFTATASGGGTPINGPANSFFANVWNHVAVTRASGTVRVFVNGVAGTPTSNTTDLSNVSYVPTIGRYAHSASFGIWTGYLSNLRYVKGTAVYTGNFTPPTNFITQTSGTYPSTTNVNTSITAANTSLLANFADSNYVSATNGVQNNTFVDSSNYAWPITRVGTATQGSFTPYWPNGYWSNYFGGTDYFSGSSASLAFGTGNFTLEAWIYVNSLAATNGAVSTVPSGGGPGVGIFVMTNGKIRVTIGNSGAAADFDSSSTLNLNTWYHVAFVRSGSNVAVYINGTSVVTGTNSSSIVTTDFIVGRGYTNLDVARFNGYISNARITNTAVYTAAFTPNTTPLTAISGTILLTCQSNRFKDNSASPLTIGGVGGTPRVQAFQPFSPTVSYTAAAYGGSIYNTVKTDGITATSVAPLTTFTGDFTFECWVYPTDTSFAGTWGIIDTRTSGQTPTAWVWSIGGTYSSGYPHAFYTGTQYNFTTRVLAFAWTHIVLQRNGTTVRAFINGVVDATTATISGTITGGTSTVQINNTKDNGLTSYGNIGYTSNLRIVNGTAVYTTTGFTPPTAPVTAVTNTSLLLNYTNAGIYDAAVQNNAITVGDAQVSTTISKWSPSSMRFDGTVDALSILSSTAFGLGTGDWTIEFWVYLNATTQQTILSMLTTAASVAPHIYYQNASGIRYYTNNADRITGGALTTGVWNYIAVTKASGITRMYINGVQTGSNYTDANNYGTTNPFIVGNYGVPLSGDSTLNGYVQDVRITKGIARTISTPSAAFPTR